MRNMSLLVFPGVDMLQKPMMKNQFPRENMISAKGIQSRNSCTCAHKHSDVLVF